MSTFRKAAYVIGAIGIVVVSFWTTLIVLDRYSAAPSRTIRSAPASPIGDLPKIATSGVFPAAWSQLLGLKVTDGSARAAVPDQPVLTLTAASTNSGHQLEMKVSSLEKNNVYAAIIWVKPGTQTRVFVQIHDDGVQNPTNYGVIFADLSSQKIYNVQHVVSPTMQAGPDGWLKLQVPLPTADGTLSIMLGFLTDDDTTVYQGDGQSALTFGGIETLAQR